MTIKAEFVIVSGNPFDGITIWGPFEDGNEAGDWAEESLSAEEWWIVKMRDPSDESPAEILLPARTYPLSGSDRRRAAEVIRESEKAGGHA